MGNGLKLYIQTYGCQMNFRDSEALKSLFLKHGFLITNSLESADVILINTCSVRAHAEQRAFSFLGKLKRLKEKKCRIIGLIGCAAQNYKERIFKRFPFVDLVVGPANFYKLPYLILNLKDKVLEVNFEKEIDALYTFDSDREFTNPAYVTISRGCSNYCSYCIVPYVRGELVCRSPDRIIEEIRDLVNKGMTNITLLGQNVNDYSYQEIGFLELLKKITEISGLEEVGFLTSHPKNISKELIIFMAYNPKVRKHLHLPLQSGSDRILRLMERGYTSGEYRKIVDFYRKHIPEGKLTTDIIVGFPTETEKDFELTLNLIKEIRFDAAYIFKYSPRPYTKAARFLKDDVPIKEKERRHSILLELQKKISLEKKCLKL